MIRVNDDDFAELFKQLNSGQSTSGTWDDVFREFATLGRTLADALRSAPAVAQLTELLNSALTDWNTTVEGTPEAKQAREQFLRVTESLNAAVEQAGEQVRPELLRLLRQANTELRRRSGLSQEG